ncbi:hypothetical protein [Chryseobacterium sp. BIGb0232]|uniref:WD40/YVTN/BNR-like repeat-containing protein n=1 Tax=Chryseobacterium sp. BIGb0232 TaxID=2940598 RepID=UPI000F96002A|nr:hypothetical protein [Chryseobacterium sp. BIGb0232]MCS4305091.1 hypothetical protein [Chryseobacterium sp. BIGb0232]ROS08093.1 BNR-Asp box repeat protein [Chryseobacterium nakagawai]
MDWKIIDFNKIPGEKPFNTYFDALSRYKFNQIITYNKDIFFLLGSDGAENPDNENSIIYRSLDFGKTFHKTTLGKGKISEGYFTGKNLFVVLEDRNYVDGLSQISSSLFISKDFGETWLEIGGFDESVSRINFYSEKIGIASFFKEVKYGEGKEEYRYTIDGGKTWITFEINNEDFDPSTNCMFRTNSVIWFISDNSLISYNLITKELKTERKLPVPQGMKADVIDKDGKTGNPISFFGYDDNDEKGEMYYILEDKHVAINNGFGYVYGNFMYKFIEGKPYSSYMWSENLGKTWQIENMEDFFPDPIPIGYSQDGYIYMIVAMFKGSEEERGTRLVIGHPKK